MCQNKFSQNLQVHGNFDTPQKQENLKTCNKTPTNKKQRKTPVVIVLLQQSYDENAN